MPRKNIFNMLPGSSNRKPPRRRRRWRQRERRTTTIGRSRLVVRNILLYMILSGIHSMAVPDQEMETLFLHLSYHWRGSLLRTGNNCFTATCNDSWNIMRNLWNTFHPMLNWKSWLNLTTSKNTEPIEMNWKTYVLFHIMKFLLEKKVKSTAWVKQTRELN